MAKKVKTDVDIEMNDVVDIDLSVTKKKKFRINKDNSKILELNTSDMGILTRLSECAPKLDELETKIVEVMNEHEGEEDTELLTSLGTQIKEIDLQMRAVIDEIFDSNVCEICAKEGSMYDPLEGIYRYEHILNSLLPLYEQNIQEEADKIKKRALKHTAKYVKK